MDWLRKGCLVLGLSTALAAPLGCTNTPKIGNPLASNLVPTGGSAPGKDRALPDDQAAKVCMAVAENLERSGNDAGALAQYEKVAQLEPNNLKATHRLAVLYDRRCDFAKADEK